MDKAKEGWRVLEDTPFSGKDFTPIIVKFHRRDNNFISKNDVRQRTKKLGIHLGRYHAEWLLDRQNLMPKEWREYSLLFLGTVWQDRLGCYFVPSLDWDGECWCLYYRRLDGKWISDFRLVCDQESFKNRNFSRL
jgi:hypothetical protein